MTLDLHALAARFAENWGPKGETYHEFLDDLRELVEAYGLAALRHGALPDTEHAHSDATLLLQQPGVFTILAQGGEEVMHLTADGEVVVNPALTATEAASKFWAAVQTLAQKGKA